LAICGRLAIGPALAGHGRQDKRPAEAGVVYSLNMSRAVIQQTEHLELSERDSLRVLAVLENPPKPNAKLLAAAKSLPKRK
jgi:hypothetical protein